MSQRSISTAGHVLLGLFLLALGCQKVGHSYSCHICRNTKTTETIRFFWLPLRSSTRVSNLYAVPPGHRHLWFHFSHYEMLGYRGFFSSRVACSPLMYRDGKMPSD